MMVNLLVKTFENANIGLLDEEVNNFAKTGIEIKFLAAYSIATTTGIVHYKQVQYLPEGIAKKWLKCKKCGEYNSYEK